MHTFFGQPKFHSNRLGQGPIGYELFLREFKDGLWQLPEDFSRITSEELEKLLNSTIADLPANIELLSFNLEQDQFINPNYIDMVRRVQSKTDIDIYTELTERITPGVTENQLYDGAKMFHDRGLLVCIDDVGTGENSPELVNYLNPFIDEYKFAFQGFRPFDDINKVTSQLDYWYDLSNENNKMLAIEGLETAHDMEVIGKEYPCYVVQGYYTGKPAIMK
ncbi:EAL domain-containing protein [Paucilactobacillus suebicus]|uniref:C-di-GMP-specific phosphodiesterase n=1 Tax=Paucilactobacillus suebicus DSM 5007 = KCTC 3549 TaxID=1423807 RepID=A0A0R1W8U1_9LACO|nr:EAL domain-containing protein [Paucilactobacillus suebicus]KRM12292.1 C-di-GMP-specific phosphodiesterase [Paucilactobacillus suebicus DSM 5007 = KCTC 3549]